MNIDNSNNDINLGKNAICHDAEPTADEKALIHEVFLRRNNPLPDVDRQWQDFERLLKEQEEKPAPILRRHTVLLAVAAAAACVALLLILKPQGGTDRQNGIEVLASIDNAKDITMSSSDGHTDIIDGEKVSFAKQVTVKSQADCSMMTITTPRGHECEITMSDGTKVWLSGESCLEFPRNFVGKRREVRMSGEAYFEVAKDASRPFIVRNDYFSTTVLGTSFNMRAYSAADACVTLVEGKVSMRGNNNMQQILRPGQKAQYGAAGFSLADVDVYPVLQRRDGYFYFDNETLLKIMIELGRWYNKTIVFDDEEAMHERFHFVAERTQPVEEVVEALNEMDGVDVDITDTEIVVH